MLVDAPGSNPTVAGAIRQAAKLTGTNFQYLLATAQVESSLNPGAAARTSSARGLFQFVEQTWLTMLKEQGAALGYGQFASAITRQPSGRYAVSGPQTYRQIMSLRSDPTANAVMAGAFTRDNAAQLTARLGRNPTEGELYLAHFLGASGAGRLIGLAEAKPGARAADAFPHAARANRSIFYDRLGRARSASDVYRLMVNRYDVARNDPVKPAATQLAAAETSPGRAAVAPDTAQITETLASAARAAGPPARVGGASPVFHGLFRTSGQHEAVAPVVSALWSAPAGAAPQGTAVDAVPPVPNAPQPPAGHGEPLDLFQEHVPDARALFRGRV